MELIIEKAIQIYINFDNNKLCQINFRYNNKIKLHALIKSLVITKEHFHLN